MFYVKIGDMSGNEDVLYYPSDNELCIYDAVLKQTVGQYGEFSFKVTNNNRKFNMIAEHRIVTILRDDKEYWRGFIKSLTVLFDGTVEVFCLEDLAWLSYEFIPPEQTDSTKEVMFQYLVNAYNTEVTGTLKAFDLGYYDGLSSDAILYESDYETSIADGLLLVAADDKYLRVRRTNGHRYIDLVKLENFGKTTTQSIELSENLLDYAKTIDTSEMLNVMTPYGNEIPNQEVYEGLGKRIEGTVLENASSIATFGRIARNVFFDANDTETLDTLAADYFTKHLQPKVTLELSAVDMSEITTRYSDDICLGDSVEFVAIPFGFTGGDYINVIELETNIQDPGATQITLATDVIPQMSLTDLQGSTDAKVKKIPSKWEVLQAAKRNALNLLNGNAGGYVSFKFNEDGDAIEEIQITNRPTVDASTQMWKWNLSGFGYMSRETTADDWSDLGVAMTMEGEIVADFITAGELDGAVIKANSITAQMINTVGLIAENISASLMTGKKIQSPDGQQYIDLTSNSGNFKLGAIQTNSNTGRLYATRFEATNGIALVRGTDTLFQVDSSGNVICRHLTQLVP